jgi:hypothetical protein
VSGGNEGLRLLDQDNASAEIERPFAVNAAARTPLVAIVGTGLVGATTTYALAHYCGRLPIVASP